MFRTYLMIQRVGAELHGAGDDGFGGDGVQDGLGLEDDQSGNVSHDLTLLELLQVQDLQIGNIQLINISTCTSATKG